MVFSDPFRELEREGSRQFRSPIAIDRLAAFAIDGFCFSFFAFLFLAPLKRNLMIARVLEREEDFIFGYTLALVLLFALALLYQTIFLVWKGATPGKLILKLRVVNVWGDQESLSLTTAFVRSLGWCLSALFLFLPHFEIYTNGRRRPFYDRLADTEVVSLSGRYAEPPPLATVRSAKFVLLFFVLLLLTTLVHDIFRYVRVSGESQRWKEELAGVMPTSCDEVTKAQEEWVNQESSSRLTVALALYSSNNLDDDCLSVEAFKSFQAGEEVELAYLAKSFIHSDDADLSDEYLRKVCEEKENSEACEFSKMIELWALEQLPEAGEKFRALLEGGSIYIKVWAIKHFERVKDFETELAILDELWTVKSLTSFVNTHRGVAYWGLHRRDEARVAITSAISEIAGPQKLEVTSWFCYRELADSCKAVRTPSCSAFASLSEDMSEKFSSSGHLLTYLKVQECRGDKINFDDMYVRAPSEQGVLFVKAVADLKENKKDEALRILRPILFDESWDRAYKDEALRRIVEVIDNKSDLNEVAEVWSQGDPKSWEWRMQGISLVRELIKRKFAELALAVGAKLAREKGLPEEERKSLVVVAYNNGDKKLALNLIGKPERSPASSESALESQYERIYHDLYREFRK